MLSSFTQYYWIKLSLIVQNSSLLAKKLGPCLSPNVADRPLRPAKDHRLGRLLLYQQPNLSQAHLNPVFYLWGYRCITFFKKIRLSQKLR